MKRNINLLCSIVVLTVGCGSDEPRPKPTVPASGRFVLHGDYLPPEISIASGAQEPRDPNELAKLRAGNRAFHEGQIELALQTWRAVMAESPSTPAWNMAVLNVGSVLQALGRHREAIRVLKLLIDDEANYERTLNCGQATGKCSSPVDNYAAIIGSLPGRQPLPSNSESGAWDCINKSYFGPSLAVAVLRNPLFHHDSLGELGPLQLVAIPRRHPTDMDEYLRNPFNNDWHLACLRICTSFEALGDVESALNYAVFERDKYPPRAECGNAIIPDLIEVHRKIARLERQLADKS